MGGHRLVDVMPVLAWCTGVAVAANHPHVGTEHLALAALEGDDGLGGVARLLDIDPATIRARLKIVCSESRVGACDDEPRATPRVVRMLAGAAQLALVEGEPAIQPRHLVTMLLAEPGAVAWAALSSGGLQPMDVARAMAALRQPGQPIATNQAN